jgi:hypothetical protein
MHHSSQTRNDFDRAHVRTVKVFCFAAPTLCQIRGPIVPSIRHIALDHHRDPASKQKTVGPLTDKPSNELD